MVRSVSRHTEERSHLVVQKSLPGLVGLHPLAIHHKLRNGTFAYIMQHVIGRTWSHFDVDLFERYTVPRKEALGFTTITAP